MATKIRLELNHDGIKALLNSQEVSEFCREQAKEIAERAGDGFEVVGPKSLGYGGSPRVGWGVEADTYAAKLEEANNKTLSRAVKG